MMNKAIQNFKDSSLTYLLERMNHYSESY